MQETGIKSPSASLADVGLGHVAIAHWNLTPSELVEETLLSGEGTLSDTGALAIDTGEFTGRSPKDKYVVYDEKTKDSVWWGDVNHRFESADFDKLYNRVCAYFSNAEVYVRDSYACADPEFRLNIRVVTELPWSNLFANNLFLRPTSDELSSFVPEWHIINAPGFKADPAIDGTRQHNFTIINFTKKIILIGGSGYTGEIKKGIFSVLNYILPHEKNVLSMHCSANVGKDGDTAVFFGLSGTGKTTLSADPDRRLIGDDEHGWSSNSVFNFEGGCYAKCVDLSAEKEPQIFNAIRFGALLENINYFEGTRTVDYSNIEKTENTRVAYPIELIDNIMQPSMGDIPRNIFFLTADAFGVLPPISKLTPSQAMYHFISGYTAKVAGTEVGVTEPQVTFSACFGKAFLPLHPTRYAELLGKKLKENNVNVWLVNTGWCGGPYGIGSRIKLKYTRAMISAALRGELNNVEFQKTPYFGLNTPVSCPEVPTELLFPRNAWPDKDMFDQKAAELAEKFVKNFAQYADFANEEIMAASPKIASEA
ncbi:MAG TPA: phosphoenolpyruvate carboxykinase (ATP) [Flavobacteriales bacterium]|nr:phosphoenolpyruvate carboxykinase (ATP) [Flavobacteriales bacterium]